MKRLWLGLGAVVLTAAVAWGQEVITLDTPITKPSRAVIRLTRFTLDIENRSVTVEWIGDDDVPGTAVYPTPAVNPGTPSGAQLLSTLNTADLSSNSLVRRTLNRLITDGYVPAGTVTGSPQ